MLSMLACLLASGCSSAASGRVFAQRLVFGLPPLVALLELSTASGDSEAQMELAALLEGALGEDPGNIGAGPVAEMVGALVAVLPSKED